MGSFESRFQKAITRPQIRSKESPRCGAWRPFRSGFVAHRVFPQNRSPGGRCCYIPQGSEIVAITRASRSPRVSLPAARYQPAMCSRPPILADGTAGDSGCRYPYRQSPGPSLLATPSLPAGYSIGPVDDVVTTALTLGACAKAPLEIGAVSVRRRMLVSPFHFKERAGVAVP